MLSKNRIKFLQSLKQKKYRQKYGHFLVEGEKSVAELLHSEYEVDEIIADENWLSKQDESWRELEATLTDDIGMGKISAFSSPSPVCAVVKIPVSIPKAESKWAIALDGIKDPGNLGTIVRTADWYGIKQVYCSKDCVDFFNPKTISSTMGSFARIVPEYIDLKEKLGKLEHVYACVLNGTNIREVSNANGGVIVIGSESHGISDEVLALPNIERVTIPGPGGAESLNAAIATAIACERLVPYIDGN